MTMSEWENAMYESQVMHSLGGAAAADVEPEIDLMETFTPTFKRPGSAMITDSLPMHPSRTRAGDPRMQEVPAARAPVHLDMETLMQRVAEPKPRPKPIPYGKFREDQEYGATTAGHRLVSERLRNVRASLDQSLAAARRQEHSQVSR